MGRKQPKKQKVGRVVESEGHHEDENETESEDEDGGAPAGGDDSDADKALIKKMVSQYVPDKGKSLSKEETEALHKLGKEAYGAHKEMGKNEDEAFKHAGEAMKLAHHMSSKQNEEETEESEDDGDDSGSPPPKKKKAPPAKGDASDDDDDGDAGNEESEGDETESEDEGEKKESKRVRRLTKQLLEAEGRLAALEAKDKKRDLTRYVDAKLKESKQPVSVTKKFREAAGQLKSKIEFDSKWKMFLEGVKNSSDDEDFGIMMERSTVNEDGDRASGNADAEGFADCAD